MADTRKAELGVVGNQPAVSRGWRPSRTAGRKTAPRQMVPAEVVAAERAVIEECCRRILGGETLSSVAGDLDSRGLRTVNGSRWTRDGLRQMLDQPAIAGLLARNGTRSAESCGTR